MNARDRNAVRGLVAVSFASLCASCTPQGEVVSKTGCSGAIATATYAWNVAYFAEQFRNEPHRHHIETFASKTLENRNGQKPDESLGSDASDRIIGPDDNGVWWPTLPARPTAQAMDNRRPEDAPLNAPPQIQRQVSYVLQCDDGKFLANAQIYRRVGRAIAAGQTVQARYALGQLLQTEILESGEQMAAPAEAATPDPAPASKGEMKADSLSLTLYVNPSTGSDRHGGTPDQPFKTITQALSRAQSGQTVQLGPGTYDRSSGETFPLQLKPGITLLGNVPEQGREIAITGGGNFLSASWAKQNVSVVAVENSTIKGVTLSNPNTRGTAVWVESGSPMIAHNVFTNNNREGIFVSETATPQILSNLIKDNGGNGVSFTRDSGGLLAGNSIRNSGYGVAVSDRAKPLLEANQIGQNRSGVVLSGSAAPILRGNTISDNQQDGLVSTHDAQPTLEGNIFTQNGKFDLNSNSAKAMKLKENRAQLKLQGKVSQSDQ